MKNASKKLLFRVIHKLLLIINTLNFMRFIYVLGFAGNVYASPWLFTSSKKVNDQSRRTALVQ